MHVLKGESYAKLTQKEKEEQELSKREKAIAEREKAQALKELKSDVVDDLKEQELLHHLLTHLSKLRITKKSKMLFDKSNKTLITQYKSKSKSYTSSYTK